MHCVHSAPMLILPKSRLQAYWGAVSSIIQNEVVLKSFCSHSGLMHPFKRVSVQFGQSHSFWLKGDSVLLIHLKMQLLELGKFKLTIHIHQWEGYFFRLIIWSGNFHIGKYKIGFFLPRSPLEILFLCGTLHTHSSTACLVGSLHQDRWSPLSMVYLFFKPSHLTTWKYEKMYTTSNNQIKCKETTA